MFQRCPDLDKATNGARRGRTAQRRMRANAAPRKPKSTKCLNAVTGLALVAIILLLANSRQPMGQSLDRHPNPSPQSEKILTSDASFIAQCKSYIEADVQQFRWVLGKSILTRSEEFGLVWRVDFELPGESSDYGLVNRIVCWRPPGSDDIGASFLFGQHIPKLE